MKKILLILLAGLACSCLWLSACSTPGAQGQEEQGLIFNEGYLEEIELGDPIMLDEYINPNLTNDYTLILTSDETGEQFDLKAMWQWTTSYPGEFTLTYTVNSGEYAGTVLTAKLSVVVPKISWKYSRGNFVYRAGTSMSFVELEKNLNISVNSYYGWEFFIDNIQHEDGETYEIEESAKSFEFEKDGIYTVNFGVKTEDGQVRTASQKVTVRQRQIMEEGAEEWLAENNITVHDHKLVTADGQITLDSGYYTLSLRDADIPYIALNGDFGLNTYAIFEFTGSNLPQLAFFCKDVTNSITDGKEGIYLHNGLTYNDGSFLSELDASRLTVFGPNKVSYGEFDNRGRYEGATVGSVADPCPVSFLALDENCKYRYIVGFTDGGDITTKVNLHIILVNLTTGEREFNYTRSLDYITAGPIDVTYDEDYFSGSIVAYGRCGVETKIDKIYTPVVTDSIENLDIASEFKAGYRKQYDLNTVANVSDYIDIPSGEYSFRVYDPDGEAVVIAEDGSFKYEKSGTYRIYYDSLQEGIRESSITIEIMFDPNEPLADDHFEDYGSIMAAAMRSGTAMATNTNSEYIKEGKKSIRYYTHEATTGGFGLVVGVERRFTDFIFLSRWVDGFTFDVYSEQELDFKLYGAWGTREVVKDYTGTIPAETWTTVTIPRALVDANTSTYSGANYSMALSFYAEEELPAQSRIYIDNIQLIAIDNNPTITESASKFLEDNNMSAYMYKSIDDNLKVELHKGIYQGEAYAIKNDDVPYIAYKDASVAGNYVVVDFTGINVPQLCFFAEAITSSLVDGVAGVYVHTGLVKADGNYYSPTDCGRVTFLGPNKVEYCRVDDAGRYTGQYGSKDDPSPLSIRGLVEGVRYRYVIGIKSAEVGKVVLDLVLLNLDTNEKVVSYTRTLEDAAFTTEYLSGSIILYGRYNASVVLDKIYPLYTGVTDVFSIDKVVEILG